LQVDWHDGREDYETASITRVMLPINTRVLGDAKGELVTSEVAFGFVAVGAEGEAVARIKSASSSGGILAITEVSSSSEAFYVVPGFSPLANPGDEIAIPVRFAPDA